MLENDLVYDESLLDSMLIPNKIAIAKMQPWLNGTCVTINQSLDVKAFIPGSIRPSKEIKYKTVNIYSISQKSWNLIIERLDKQILENKVNNYYETVFADMIADGSLSFKATSFDNKPWYEIDTIEDLKVAEKLFHVPNHKIPKPVIPSFPELLNNKLRGKIIPTPKAIRILNAT